MDRSSRLPHSQHSPFQMQTAQPSIAASPALDERALERHMAVSTYGAFELTDAVRPSRDLKILPKQGYRHDTYVDSSLDVSIPVVMAAASRQNLFDLFLQMLDPLGNMVDVVLETSHCGTASRQRDLYREDIDLTVLKSILCDHESLILDDGCMGIAILNPRRQLEVQFDEHKVLIAYGSQLAPFEKILIDHDVYPDPKIRFLSEAEHIHSSSDRMADEVEQLIAKLGIEVAQFWAD